MSTDLELSVKFPKIRFPVNDIESLKSSSDDSGSVIIQTQLNGDGEESCQTPTSAVHKIPTIVSCPSAPRKPKRKSVLCKRKLEFFEIENFHEVEDLFRSSFDSIEKEKKRRCTSCK